MQVEIRTQSSKKEGEVMKYCEEIVDKICA